MSFPLPPAPITWTQLQAITSTELRADPGNLAWLLTSRPQFSGAQISTAQTIPGSTITPVDIDTEFLDNFNGHAVGGAHYTAEFAGWYLAEGNTIQTGTSTSCNYGAAIEVKQNSVVSDLFGGFLCANGVNDTIPAVSDLVQLSAVHNDTVALCAYQTSGGTPPLDTPGAYFSVEWVALPTSTTDTPHGTVVTSPQPAALWPPGSGTLITNGGGIAAGATSMTVGETTGMLIGGTLGLDYYQGQAVQPYAEPVTITGISGSTVSISATSYAHAQNAPVAIPVSAAWMNQQVRDIINFLAYPPICRLNNQGTSQSLASQTMPAATAVTFLGADVDNFSGWNGTTEYVFPVSGVYYVYGQVFFSPASGSVACSAGLSVSGGTIQWGDSARSQTAGLSLCVTVRKHLRVTAGQNVQVFGSQNSGGGLTLDGTGDAYSTMVIVWRGF